MDDCFNEAEVTVDASEDTKEPEMEKICPNSYKRHKSKGKRETNLSGIETEEVYHELSEEELIGIFGHNGWKRLPDETYKRLTFHPATFKVEEHHVAVYAGKIIRPSSKLTVLWICCATVLSHHLWKLQS